MLDYHGHIAVLPCVRAALDPAFGSGPVSSAAADLGKAVDADPDAAYLGALMVNVLERSRADDVEVALLADAADLWQRARAVYDELALARHEIEQAILPPAVDGALQVLQSGFDRLNGLQARVKEIAAAMPALQAAIDGLPHLPAHPRQEDRPANEWGWWDAFAGRRTEAFVRALFQNAVDDRTRAFAVGALAAYAGDVGGSAFLGAVVGGPRRSHRFRHRLARNAIGGWLHATSATPTTTKLAAQISYLGIDGKPTFPGTALASLTQALATAFPSRAAPNLRAALAATIRHLELLDRFDRPPLPEPPVLFVATAEGTFNGDIPGGTIGQPPPDGTGNPPGTGPDADPLSPQGADNKKSSGDTCLKIILVIVTIGIALLLYCIGQWTTGHKCVPGDFFDTAQGSEEPDPRAPTNATQQQLAALSQPEAAAHVLQEIYALQMTMWQAFDAARNFLATTGMIYPDDLHLGSPLFTQFLKTPNRPAWPHRPDPAPDQTYHVDPTGPFEQPATEQPFPAHRGIGALTAPWPNDFVHSAAMIAVPLLEDVLFGAPERENLDRDADRGFRHPCWDVRPGTSINDPALTVEVLPYGAE
jgi:hypothetical protein